MLMITRKRFIRRHHHVALGQFFHIANAIASMVLMNIQPAVGQLALRFFHPLPHKGNLSTYHTVKLTRMCRLQDRE